MGERKGWFRKRQKEDIYSCFSGYDQGPKPGLIEKNFRSYLLSSTLQDSRNDILLHCFTALVIKMLVDTK